MYAHYAPEPVMRLNVGIRRRLAPLCGYDRGRIELLHSLLMTLPGTPILYYGDEIGMGDDLTLPDRNGVRTPMQWNDGPGAGFSSAERTYAPLLSDPLCSPERVNVAAAECDPASLLHWVRRLIATRKQHPAVGAGSFAMLPSPDPALAVFLSMSQHDAVVAVHNLSTEPRRLSLSVPALAGRALRLGFGGRLEEPVPIDTIATGDALPVALDGHGYAWWWPVEAEA